jgi:type I restriction enzyme S subunit
MKPYSKYKSSGVEWIGDIPEHWVVKRLKFIGDAIGGLTYSPNDIVDNEYDGKLVLRSSNIQNGKLSLEDNVYVNTSIPNKIVLRKGDILICSRNGSKHLIGKNILIDEQMEGNTFGAFMMIFRSNQYNFLYQYFNSAIFTSQSGLFLTATINQLTSNTINNFIIALPPLPEQTAIANFLDRKTAELDTLIANKQRLIQLLKEERTAIINHAITKGISGLNHDSFDLHDSKDYKNQENKNQENQSNPKNHGSDNVRYKDSGIEWIGEIPEHWEVKKLKHIKNKIGSGITPRGGAEVYLTSGYPLIRSQNIYFDGIRLDDVAYISEEIHNSMSNSKVYPNDVLINITGGSIGRCYFVSNEFNEANVNQHVCIIRPNQKILTEYLYNLLRSDICQLQITLSQTGGNREALNFEDLKNFIIPLPNIEEQTIILENIKNKEGEINTIISQTEKEIELLKEYKTALISEVVLGKVDVREETLSESGFTELKN